MNAADYVILGVLAISLIYGMYRGFMREALGLLAWLGGMWIAWKYADSIKPMWGGLLAEEPLRTWVSRAAILALVVLIVWLIAEIIAYFVHQSGLSVTVDRALGGVFGTLRGIVLVALMAMLGVTVHLDEMRWWKKSELIPYTVDVSRWISQFAETAMDALPKAAE